MSGPVNAITPALFGRSQPAGFTADNTTVAKILVDAMPGAAASGVLPATYGGGTVIDITATSSDSVNRDILLYTGTVNTTNGSATGAMTTTSSTIPRTTGSFIADGFMQGDMVMVFAPFGTAPNTGVDGIACIVHGITATTLTLNGTPLGAVTLAAGTRICRVKPHLRATVSAGAGTNGSTTSLGLIGNSLDGSSTRYELKLGPASILVAAMQATISALPALIGVDAALAQY